MDQAFPFLIQFVRESQEKIDKLMKFAFPPKKEEEKSAAEFDHNQTQFLGQPLAITYPDQMAGASFGMGMAQGGVGMVPPGFVAAGMPGGVPGMPMQGGMPGFSTGF